MQRVAIARALINDPLILLADEPTGNLDSATGSEILTLLKRFQGERTFVIVTHDHSMESVADRSIHIRDGRLA
jgi:putative ABC transport system ATP-binding protein